MGLLRNLLMGLMVAAIIMGVAEIVARVVIPKEALLFGWEREDGVLDHDDTGGVSTRPNVDGRYLDGPYEWVYHTNELGFREDKSIPAEEGDDVTRILAVGDSWVFGTSATQGKSMPAQLERLLPPRLGVARVQIINAGIPSGTAFDMLRIWRSIGWSWDLDGVLLGRPHNEHRQVEAAAKRQAWYESVRGAPRVDVYLYLMLRRAIAPMMRPAYPHIHGQGIDTALADLKIVATEARERGLPVWMALWPTAWAVEPPPQTPWTQALGPLGVRYAGHALGERSCWGFQDLGHPSEAGYRVIAEVLADLIAGGESSDTLLSAPRCADTGELGPGLRNEGFKPTAPRGPPLGPDGQPIPGATPPQQPASALPAKPGP